MELDDDPRGYEDIDLAAGVDLVWGFQLQPWDATGTSAQFNLNGINFSMAIIVTPGDDVISEFDIHLTPSQLITAGLGARGAVAPYFVNWTDTDGKLWQLGYGEVVIT